MDHIGSPSFTFSGDATTLACASLYNSSSTPQVGNADFDGLDMHSWRNLWVMSESSCCCCYEYVRTRLLLLLLL